MENLWRFPEKANMATIRKKDIPKIGIANKPNSGTVAVMVFVCVITNPLILALAIMLKFPDVAVEGILNDSAKLPF
jgi:hypothetical protein